MQNSYLIDQLARQVLLQKTTAKHKKKHTERKNIGLHLSRNGEKIISEMLKEMIK